MKLKLYLLVFAHVCLFILTAPASALTSIHQPFNEPGALPPDPDALVTLWQTKTENESIVIPINPAIENYNYTVQWGDGTQTTGVTTNASHVYVHPGSYGVAITGNFPAIQFGSDASDAGNDHKLLAIQQWGK